MTKFADYNDGSPHVLTLGNIAFQGVPLDAPDVSYKHIPTVTFCGDETDGGKLNLIYKAMALRYWWLQRYWGDKYSLSEVIEIRGDNLSIDLFNFNRSLLGDHHLHILGYVFSLMAGNPRWLNLNTADYVLLDNVQYTNPRSGRQVFGAGPINDRAMIVFPAGMKNAPYRNLHCPRFLGILLHELAHSFANSFSGEWERLFGWNMLPAERFLPGGHVVNWECGLPDRCLTEYATMSVYDDICETMVGTCSVPNQVDPEKKCFLVDRLDLRLNRLGPIQITRQQKEKLQLPKLDRPVYRLRRWSWSA